MTQVEKRILELEFDNKNFEANVKSTVSSLEDLEKHLELKNAGKGFEDAERASSNVKFKGLRDAINSVAEKFSSFRQSAAKDISDVEASGSRFNLRNMLSSIASVGTAFLSMGRSSRGEISDLEGASQRFSMQSMASAVQEVSDRFSALGIVGITVLQDLTHAALNAGKSLASNIIDPIVQGGKKRAFALENARFTLQGLIKDSDGGAEQIEAIMQAASDSVSGTAYALDDAASAAAQFAATGMRAGKDTRELENALAAIAGTSATVNAEYSDIAHIFTTVAGNGRLMTEQLNQFSYRGMNAAATLKDAYNAVLDGTSTLAPEIQQQIRDTVEYGMSEIKDFSGSLEGITEGDLRQLVSKGKVSFDIFSAIMSDTFGEHAKDANKTFNGSMANIRAALARTGAMFYTDLIQQEGPLVQFFNHIREAVNAFNNALKPFASMVTTAINAAVTHVNTFLEKFEAFQVFEALSVPLESFVKILQTIGEAFGSVFKAMGEADINNFAAELHNFIASLKVSDEQLESIRTVATGVASAFKILGNVISALVRFAKGLVTAFKPAIDLFVQLVEVVANAVTEFSNFIEESGILNNAVDLIVATIGAVIKDITGFVRGVGAIFAALVDAIGNSVRGTELLAAVGNKASEVFKGIADGGGVATATLNVFKEAVGRVADVLDPVLSKLKELASTVGGRLFQGLSDAINNLTFDNIVQFVELLLKGVLVMSVKKAFDSITEIFSSASEFIKGIGDKLSEAGAGLKDFFSSIAEGQNTIVPAQVIKIAGAVAILAGALYLVASLSAGELAAGVAGLGAAMVEMGLFIKALNTLMASTDPRAIASTSGYILALSAAMFILASAIHKMGTMNYTEIVRGLVGLGTSMAIFTKSIQALSKSANPAVLTKISGSIMTLAAAMVVLSLAFKVFSTIDLQGIAKGLAGIGGSMAIFVAFSKTVKPYSLTACASAMLKLAAAMVVLSAAFKVFESMSWEGVAKGLLSVAGSLAVFVVYSKLVKPGPITQTATSLIALSVALIALAAGMKIIETISWEGIAKGFTVLGGAMAAFIVYSRLVKPQSIAQTAGSLILFAGSLVIIAQAFNMMSNLSFESIIQSSLAFIAVLAAFAIAATKLNKSVAGMLSLLVVPAVLIPLALALGMLAAIPLPGLVTGIAAVAAVIAIFAIAGSKLMAAIPGMLAFAGTMLAVGAAIGIAGAGIGLAALGLGAFATAIAAAGTAIVVVLVELASQLPVIIGYLIDAFQVFLVRITEIMPQIAAFVSAGIQMIVSVFLENLPIIMQAIGEFFLQLIQTVTTYIPQIVEMIMQFLATLLQTFLAYAPQIGEAVMQIIVTILQTIANHIEDIVTAALSIAEGFIRGIANGIGGVIDAAFQLVISFVNGLADAIRSNHGAVFDAVGNLIMAIVEAIADGVAQVISAAGELISGFFEGLMEGDPLGRIGEFATDLIMGFIEGIGNMVGEAISAIQEFGQSVLDGLAEALGIASPSTKAREIGEYTGDGFIDGLEEKGEEASGTGEDFAEKVLKAFGDSVDQAVKYGDKLTGGLITGLQKQGPAFLANGIKDIADFTSGVLKMAPAAQNAGVGVTSATLTGIQSNAPQYGTTGNQEATSFVDNVSLLAGNAMTAGIKVTRETVRGLGFNFAEYGQTGTAEGGQYVGGISGRAYSAMQAGLQVTRNTISGLLSNFGEYSPTGSSEGGAYAGGVGSRTGDAKSAGRSLSSSAKDGAGEGDFEGVGRNVGWGFIRGIESMSSRVWNAARSLASDALESMKQRLDEASPSKETRKIGAFAGQGLALGMADTTNEVVRAADKLGGASMEALEDALQAATVSIMYSDFDSQPTITPVVDLSNVTAASSQINQLFAQSGALTGLDTRVQVAASGYEAAMRGSEVKAPEPTIIQQTFEQNNYSPKSLDELEIYRKSKSMFATARGVGSFVDRGVTYAQ